MAILPLMKMQKKIHTPTILDCAMIQDYFKRLEAMKEREMG